MTVDPPTPLPIAAGDWLDRLLAGAGRLPRPATTADAIVVQDLTKRYPDGTVAVRGLSFRVRAGERYGILGPNGAGKSTTIGMLGTLVVPTSGRAVVGGFDVTDEPGRVRSAIGFAMQDVGVDELATGREFLVLQGRLHGLGRAEARRRAETLLGLVELADDADRRLGAYSGGMKRRIDLASALIHLPSILFLDEPTEGLDPRARMVIWEALSELNRVLGVTVVLSTHFMDEADRLCDRLGIVDAGRIVAEGTPAELKASVGGQSLVLAYGADAPPGRLDRARTAIAERRDVRDLTIVDGDVAVQLDDPAGAAPDLLRMLERAGAGPRSLSIRQPSLEDVYLRYTGRSFQGAEAPVEPALEGAA